MIASSPISKALSPAVPYAAAPCSPAPITASDRPFDRASARQASIAAGQCNGSPSGSPLARLTEPIAR